MPILTQPRASGGHAWRALLVVVSIACAREDEGPLPIDVCGQETPVQILQLGDDEFVDPSYGVARFGDRWLFGVQRFEIPLSSIASTWFPPADRTYAQLDARVESVGDCGQDPRVVAQDVDLLFEPLAEDQPWLGCRRDTGDLYWIDPEGTWAPRWIARAADCSRHIVHGHDVFVVLADSGDFVHARLADGGVAVDVLVTDTVQASSFYAVGEDLLFPEDVFLLRGTDRVLVRVDLVTGAIDEVLDRVDDFSITADRRWLVWTRRIQDDPNDVLVPEARLLDRSTGTERVLGRPEWFDIDAGVGVGFATAVGSDEMGVPIETELVSLSELRSEFLEGRQNVWGSDGANRVVTRSLGSGGTVVLDLGTGDRWTIFEESIPFGVSDSAVWHDDGTAYEDLDTPDYYRPVDIVRIPLATLEPEVVYRRVFSHVEISGDRWPVLSEFDENGLVDLVLVDGQSLAARLVDRNLVPVLRSYVPDGDRPFKQPWLTDELVYQVHERDSERGGMWRVRFSN